MGEPLKTLSAKECTAVGAPLLLGGVGAIIFSAFAEIAGVVILCAGILLLVAGVAILFIPSMAPTISEVEEVARKTGCVNKLFTLANERGLVEGADELVLRNIVTGEDLTVALREDCLYFIHEIAGIETTLGDNEVRVGTLYASMRGAPSVYRYVFAVQPGEALRLDPPSDSEMEGLPRDTFFADDTDLQMLCTALQTWDVTTTG